MRLSRSTAFARAGVFVIFLGSMTATPALAVTETVVTGAEIDGAVSARADEDAAARETIQNLLGRDATRDAAEQIGVDLERLKAGAATLSGDELREVAAQARLADEALLGGDEKIVIGSTVLIVILLVVIILVAA